MKTLKQIFALASIIVLVANPVTGYCASLDYFQSYLNQQSEQTQPTYTPAWQPVAVAAQPSWNAAAYTTTIQPPSFSAATIPQAPAEKPWSFESYTTTIQPPSPGDIIIPQAPAEKPFNLEKDTTTIQPLLAQVQAESKLTKEYSSDMRAAIAAQLKAAKDEAADMRAAITAQLKEAKTDAAEMRAAIMAQAKAEKPWSFEAYTATLSPSTTLPTLPGSINTNQAANAVGAEKIGMLQYALRQELIQSKYNFGGTAAGTPPNMNEMLQLASIMVAGYKAEHPDATPVYMTINGKKVEVTGLGKEQYVNTPGGIMRSETPISGEDPSKWTANDLPFLVGITSYSDLQADYQDGNEFGVKFVGTAGHVTFGEDTVRSRKLGNTDPIPAITQKTYIQENLGKPAKQTNPEDQENPDRVNAAYKASQAQNPPTIKTSAPCKIGDAYGAEKDHGERVETITANPDGTWSIETNLDNKYRLPGIAQTPAPATTPTATPSNDVSNPGKSTQPPTSTTVVTGTPLAADKVNIGSIKLVSVEYDTGNYSIVNNPNGTTTQVPQWSTPFAGKDNTVVIKLDGSYRFQTQGGTVDMGGQTLINTIKQYNPDVIAVANPQNPEIVMLIKKSTADTAVASKAPANTNANTTVNTEDYSNTVRNHIIDSMTPFTTAFKEENGPHKVK